MMLYKKNMARPWRIVFEGALMGNHYHLLLKTKRANLSKSMQSKRAI